MTLFIPAMWAIIRFFHVAAHLTLVTSGVMATELAAQARLPAGAPPTTPSCWTVRGGHASNICPGWSFQLFGCFLHPCGPAHTFGSNSSCCAQDAPPAPSIEVWKKGVCSDTFHPRFRSQAMRERLSGGNPEAPILLSVGRLGNEKNLKFLKACAVGAALLQTVC